MINEYPINHKPINVSGPWTTSDETWYGGVSGTLKNYPETYTATRNWFVSLTPDIPDPEEPPDIPEGAIGISTIEELQLIGNDPAYPLDEYYVLLNEIDASATATWNAGAGFKPIGTGAAPFTGTLDGQGFGVTDLYIDRPGENYAGLFGVVGYGGTVTNCYVTGAISGDIGVGGLVGYNYHGTVTNCYATGEVTGEQFVGGLVGGNYGTVTNCYATGTVTGDYDVGGLVGVNDGTITNCYATGEVTGEQFVGGLVGYNVYGTVTNCYATGAVTGNTNVGGLVGSNNDGTVTNCYASGAVTGYTQIGGLVGYNVYGTVTDCYATGTVTGYTQLGGLVGRNNIGGTVTASYYDTQTTGQADNTGKGAPRTTAAMYQQATFTGWDFGVVWTIIENTDYPRLLWESGGT